MASIRQKLLSVPQSSTSPLLLIFPSPSVYVSTAVGVLDFLVNVDVLQFHLLCQAAQVLRTRRKGL